MRQTNTLVESLQKEAGVQMQERFANDNEQYSSLLKNLLVQGLIKLIEAKVTLRCRESDVDTLKAVIDDAVAEYKEKMLD